MSNIQFDLQLPAVFHTDNFYLFPFCLMPRSIPPYIYPFYPFLQTNMLMSKLFPNFFVPYMLMDWMPLILQASRNHTEP